MQHSMGASAPSEIKKWYCWLVPPPLSQEALITRCTVLLRSQAITTNQAWKTHGDIQGYYYVLHFFRKGRCKWARVCRSHQQQREWWTRAQCSMDHWKPSQLGENDEKSRKFSMSKGQASFRSVRLQSTNNIFLSHQTSHSQPAIFLSLLFGKWDN